MRGGVPTRMDRSLPARGKDLVERAGQDRRRVADRIGGAEPHKPIRSDQHGTLRTDAAVLQPPAHDVDMVDVAESDSGRAQRYAALCSDFQRGLDPVPPSSPAIKTKWPPWINDPNGSRLPSRSTHA